ncbi:MAG: response regulator [Chloroflexota bacterium]
MPGKIMVVDDDKMLSKMLSTLLSNHGFHTIHASDGIQALEQLEKSVPALILLDVMMPEMDGFEVCEKIRSNPKTVSIPIIMLTALDSAEYKERGIELGVDDYMTKPCNTTELIARINTLLNRTDS